ncbi:MAG: glycosyltransferase family A protein [Nitrososphaera sp.]
MSFRVGVVIPARNEEKFIAKTLTCLLNDQKIKPEHVIVVDDGSTDNTAQVASSFSAEVIRLPDRGYQAQGNPILAEVINHGLRRIDEYLYGQSTTEDYVMILGADNLLPPNYISDIISEMQRDRNIAICSGIVDGEAEKNQVPRGAGRIVRANFWRQIGLEYPSKYGYEAYLVFKALQMGYATPVLTNLVTKTQRRTGKNYGRNTYIGYGKALKALGYSRLYSLGKLVLVLLRNPGGALLMFKGYSSRDIDSYDMELQRYVRSLQHEQIRNYFLGKRKTEQ